MPHKCSNCDQVYPDGSDNILTGCNECGENKFEYIQNNPTKDNQTEDIAQQQARKETSDVPLTSLQSQKSINISNNETDTEEIKQRLNEQFESIKIVEPGQYELNLMKLFKRDERIISLHEDGRYSVHLSSEDTLATKN